MGIDSLINQNKLLDLSNMTRDTSKSPEKNQNQMHELKAQYEEKYKKAKKKQNQTYNEKLRLMKEENNLKRKEDENKFYAKLTKVEENFCKQRKEFEERLNENEHQIKQLKIESQTYKKFNGNLKTEIGGLNYEKTILNEKIFDLEKQIERLKLKNDPKPKDNSNNKEIDELQTQLKLITKSNEHISNEHVGLRYDHEFLNKKIGYLEKE